MAGTGGGDDEPIVRVRGLVNRFGSQVVHEGLDLDVRRGEILGIVGGSGSGKSVLMRSIIGLRQPQGGAVEVLGVDALSEEAEDTLYVERNTGVLFQDGALFSSLTVGENVQVPLKEHHPGLPDSLRYELSLLKVKLAGLPANALDKLPSQLSGGMRKRVDLARAYANSPDVLLMDEPFAALDVQTKAVMQQAVLELWKSTGKTVVFVTHDLEEAVFLSDLVVVLSSRPGRIHSLVEIHLARPRSEETRVSDEFFAAKRELWNALQAARKVKG